MSYRIFKLRTILILLFLSTQLINLSFWTKCFSLQYFFHFSSYDLGLQLLSAIHNDSGLPLILTRILSNKLDFFLIDIFSAYLQFFDPQFLISLFSLLGFLNIFAGILFAIKDKRKLPKILIIVFLLIPFLEIFSNSHFFFVLFYFSFAILGLLLSFYGTMQFLVKFSSSNKVFIFLLAISLLWILFLSNNVHYYCR